MKKKSFKQNENLLQTESADKRVNRTTLPWEILQARSKTYFPRITRFPWKRNPKEKERSFKTSHHRETIRNRASKPHKRYRVLRERFKCHAHSPSSRKVPSHPFCHTLNTGPVQYYSLSLSLHTHLSLSRFEKEEREEKENNSCIMQVTTDLEVAVEILALPWKSLLPLYLFLSLSIG